MRYIADANGYLKEVSFGATIECNGAGCTEYTGSVPSGYDSLVAWFVAEADKLYRWKIVNGELTLDSTATAPADAKETNHLKTYSDFKQLGLSGGVTTAAVLAAMPTWSIVIFTNSNKNGNHLTDAPTEYCNVVLFKSNANYGSGIATKVNSARQEHYMYSWYISGVTNNQWSTPGQMDFLWQNAAPTSTFKGFTPIALDMTDYQYVLVWYRLYASDSTAQHISSIVPVGVGSGTKHEDTVNATTCFAAINDKWVRRYCFASSSAITFGSGGYRTSVSSNYTVDSTYMIPYRIYGIR